MMAAAKEGIMQSVEKTVWVGKEGHTPLGTLWVGLSDHGLVAVDIQTVLKPSNGGWSGSDSAR